MDNDIFEIKKLYLNHVDQEPLSLKEMAEQYNVSFKALYMIYKKENWEVQRLRNKNKLDGHLAKAKQEALEGEAIDLAKEQTKMARRKLEIINNDLPVFHRELLQRMPTMEDKNFISAYKILLTLETDMFNMLMKIGKDLNDSSEATEENVSDGIDLGLSADIIKRLTKRMKQIPDLNADSKEDEELSDEAMNDAILSPDELDEIFNKLDG